MDITWKELFTIFMAVHTWGSLWQRQKILFHCDNQAVAIVSIWKAGSKETIALVCVLYYSAAKHNINVCIAHIAGAKNNIAVLFPTGQIQEASTTDKFCTGQHPCLADGSFIDVSCSATILQ